jgi:hypothetical protein
MKSGKPRAASPNTSNAAGPTKNPHLSPGASAPKRPSPGYLKNSTWVRRLNRSGTRPAESAGIHTGQTIALWKTGKIWFFSKPWFIDRKQTYCHHIKLSGNNMSGRPDYFFLLNPFTRKECRHISFDDCQKCKFLHFWQSCFPQSPEQTQNTWYKGFSSINRSYSLFFIDRQNGPCHVWIEKYWWGALAWSPGENSWTLWAQEIEGDFSPGLIFFQTLIFW